MRTTARFAALLVSILAAKCLAQMVPLSYDSDVDFAIAVGMGVSGDGLVTAGATGHPEGRSSGELRACWWGPDGARTGVPLGVDSFTYARAISRDGAAIVGYMSAPNYSEAYTAAFRWALSGSFQALARPAGSTYCGAFAAGAGGVVVVGEGNAGGSTAVRALRWDGAGAITFLPALSNNHGSSARGVSADGSIIGGQSSDGARSFGVRWINGVLTPLPAMAGSEGESVNAMNDDGSVLGGGSIRAGGARSHAYLWRAATGGFQDLDGLPGAELSEVTGMSGDATVVIGSSIFDNYAYSRTWVYTAALGVVETSVYLQQRGVDITGWTSLRVSSASSDGLRLAGTGRFGGVTRAFQARIPCLDRDADGLCDDWEVNGIPYNDAAGATHRYLLDINGDGVSDASPLRKDIFVEVDAMVGCGTVAGTLDRVVEAFDRAPVPAPLGVAGGLPGVALHLQIDNRDISTRPYPNKFIDFVPDKQFYFGTDAESLGSNWPSVRVAKGKAFRYCIFAYHYGATSSSGLSEGYGCDDFMITVGSWSFPDDGARARAQAATFMHELGHTLGLRHGGGDDLNFKPNYFSSMNYLWQLPSFFNEGDSFDRYFPDYSRRACATLDENALIEQNGVDGDHPEILFEFNVRPDARCGHYIRTYEYSPGQPATYSTDTAQFNVPVDWDNNCTVTPGPVGRSPSHRPPPDTEPRNVLVGFDDWPVLLYNFRNSSYYLPGAPADTLPVEYTSEQYVSAMAPTARPPCFSVAAAHTAACGSNPAHLSAAPQPAAAATYKWQALSSRGRFIQQLTNGHFVDDRTGLSYDVAGATTANLTISNIHAGATPLPLRFAAVLTTSCGTVGSGDILLTINSADFNNDGDTGTDADIEAFFACLGGTCCPTCGTADFNGDGDTGTDQDIESFFRVLAGGNC